MADTTKMGGKGSGGAHNILPLHEEKRRVKIRIAQLYDPALKTINKAIAKGQVAPAMWVIEMVDGKPKQKVASELSGTITLRVVYDGSEGKKDEE